MESDLKTRCCMESWRGTVYKICTQLERDNILIHRNTAYKGVKRCIWDLRTRSLGECDNCPYRILTAGNLDMPPLDICNNSCGRWPINGAHPLSPCEQYHCFDPDDAEPGEIVEPDCITNDEYGGRCPELREWLRIMQMIEQERCRQ